MHGPPRCTGYTERRGSRVGRLQKALDRSLGDDGGGHGLSGLGDLRLVVETSEHDREELGDDHRLDRLEVVTRDDLLELLERLDTDGCSGRGGYRMSGRWSVEVPRGWLSRGNMCDHALRAVPSHAKSINVPRPSRASASGAHGKIIHGHTHRHPQRPRGTTQALGGVWRGGGEWNEDNLRTRREEGRDEVVTYRAAGGVFL